MAQNLSEEAPTSTTSSSLDKWDPLREHYTSAINSLNLDVTGDAAAAIRGYQSVANMDYCQHFAKYGNCMDEQYCRKKHLAPDSENLHKEKEFVLVESMMKRDFIYANSSKLFLAQVTYLDRPNQFQVMLPFSQRDFRHYKRKEINHIVDNQMDSSPARIAMEHCHRELKATYGKHYRLDNINIAPAITQLVAVELPNGSFCRAVVTDIIYDDALHDSYEVRLVDTGCSYILNREAIHPLPAEFLGVEPQSIPCRLPLTVINQPSDPDIDLDDERDSELVRGWPKETMDAFVEFCTGKNLLVRLFYFNEMDGVYTVDLYDYNTKTSIINTMVTRRLARLINYDTYDYSWILTDPPNHNNNGFV